jgi:hypothetical protein
MDKQEFIANLEAFVKYYQSSHIIDEVVKNKILQYSTAWNKEVVMEELIKRIDEHRLYEEDSFPHLSFVDKFLSTIPTTINSIKEVDLS